MNLKDKFPIFKKNKNLIYFDNSATTLKPITVIGQEMAYLTNIGANPNSNDYEIAIQANELLATTRNKIARFINAPKAEEIIFTSGTTHAINQIAFGLKQQFQPGDEIVVTAIEHSANLLPWVVIGQEFDLVVKKLLLNQATGIDLDQIKNVITSKTKVVSFAAVSNTIGYVNEVDKIIAEIRKINQTTIVVVDCAQSIAHLPTDVQQWDADFIAFSAHKMYGPFGIGVLWGKTEHLTKLAPIFYGGGMSSKINLQLTDYVLEPLPSRLEAGTPNISAIAGFDTAIDFLNEIGMENIHQYEKELKNYAIEQIEKFNLKAKIDFYNLDNDAPMLTFNAHGFNPQDVANYLSFKYNIATRSGSHCARRTDEVLPTSVSVRASFGVYNTKAEIDLFIQGLGELDNFLDIIF